MSSTIDAIQEKLSPQRLTEQAKDAVRDATVGRVQDMASNITETARDTGSTLMDTIRENPLPAALVGIGVGWLFLSARRKAAERDRWRSRRATSRDITIRAMVATARATMATVATAHPPMDARPMAIRMTATAKQPVWLLSAVS